MSVTQFIENIKKREAVVGIIGLGYVGLPLALLCLDKKFQVIGFDTDTSKIAKLFSGVSYIKHIDISKLHTLICEHQFDATSDYERLSECDIVIICVPTPLNRNREPDMQYVRSTAFEIKDNMRGETLVVLESTTYPGTTNEMMQGVLSSNDKLVGQDYFLAFSPEREDPGNKRYNTATIPKVVGGVTPGCLAIAEAFYTEVMEKVVPVSSTGVAEMTKILENTFRSVNIALVNELKMLCDAMDINIWEVIDAAATKPFGYMPFYPGPGLGGHCIPIDPFYLTWKAREYGLTTRFIELAGEINTSMHHWVIDKIVDGLNDQQRSINGSQVLILGVAYKSDIDDMRESPALPLIEMLSDRGAIVGFHDPYVGKLEPMRHFDFSNYENFDNWSIDLTPGNINSFHAVVIVTAHSNVDYDLVVKHSRLVIDTRNATKSITDGRSRIILA